MSSLTPPAPGLDAALVLADGRVFWGKGLGAPGMAVGEVCFNTSMTGYQEILTDPSYAGQIITFTFPHIGNVGANPQDNEAQFSGARGFVLRENVTEPANWRATQSLDAWAARQNLIGLAGIDTRALTRHIRAGGAPTGVIAFDPKGGLDIAAMREQAKSWPGLQGMDLAKEVTTRQAYDWSGEARWHWESGYAQQTNPRFHVVAMDFGAKHNILRCLADAGCKVTVLPATATADEILARRPDGVFLSNGPGDPAATGQYAVPVIRQLIDAGLPLFGICLGHQMLALALGGKTYKLPQGHRGANHPVKNLETGQVEITSQNHGFAVDAASLPPHVIQTHVSLFDGTNEGLRVADKPIFSVQHHPEASPGPQDSHYLFRQFIDLMNQKA